MGHNDGIFALRRDESCIRPNSGDHKDRPYRILPNTFGRVVDDVFPYVMQFVFK